MLILRPYSLPFPTLFSKSLLLRNPVLSLLSTSAGTSTDTPLPSLTSTPNPNPNPHLKLSYGPSLHKGKPPPPHHPHPHLQLRPSEPLNEAKQQTLEEEEEEGEAEDKEGVYVLDEGAFTRVFDIAAIRVPSGECASLESRLRGHLLNWPRIRNIARVPGDEVEEELANLFEKKGIDCGGDDGDGDTSFMLSLNRRLYGKGEWDGDRLSPVLYRDKLVKTFNSRGFEKFRNLAKMSRPRQKKKRKQGESGAGKKGKNEFAMVEVVEEEEQGEDLSGLLGEGFKGRRWRGSTRLLLLDEKYAGRGVDGLPEAIKVAVQIL